MKQNFNITLIKTQKLILGVKPHPKSINQIDKVYLNLKNIKTGYIFKNDIIFNKVAWPSGLRRWFKAPVVTGVGSNPTAIKFFFLKKKFKKKIIFQNFIFYNFIN